MAVSRPGAVLFACNQNRVRSPMAMGLMQRLFGGQIYVDSCGADHHKDPSPDPFMVVAMDERGIDLSGHKPKRFEDLEDSSFDLVISLTPKAHHLAVELTRRQAVEAEYWPTLDPTLTEGSREIMLQAYRDVRDALEARIRARFSTARTFGG